MSLRVERLRTLRRIVAMCLLPYARPPFLPVTSGLNRPGIRSSRNRTGSITEPGERRALKGHGGEVRYAESPLASPQRYKKQTSHMLQKTFVAFSDTNVNINFMLTY